MVIYYRAPTRFISLQIASLILAQINLIFFLRMLPFLFLKGFGFIYYI